MKDCIFHGAFLAGVTAVILTTVCAFFCSGILHILSTSEDIFQNAYSYLLFCLPLYSVYLPVLREGSIADGGGKRNTINNRKAEEWNKDIKKSASSGRQKRAVGV